MKLNRKSVPTGITLAALMVILAHGDARAESAAARKGVRESHVRRGRKAASPRRAARVRRQSSNLRERAAAVEPLIAAAAVKYGVDPYALWAIAYKETRFRWWLVSPKGARGMMQFLPGTAREYGLRDPHNVADAVDAAARYVRRAMNQFDDRLDLVWASYNAGLLAVEAYQKGKSFTVGQSGHTKVINPGRRVTGGVPPYSETRDYVAVCWKVYLAAQSAGLFSEDTVARSRAGRLPDAERARQFLASYRINDSELAYLGGAQNPAFYGFSPAPAVAGAGPKSSPRPFSPPAREVAARRRANSALEEVFFDVHSGVRYLVRGGEIVRPLGGVAVGVEHNPENETGESPAFVAKSVFYGYHSE
jgi:hypothetical protein